MGRMKDYLLELQEKEMNYGNQTELLNSTTMDLFSRTATPASNNNRAHTNSVQIKKAKKSIKYNSEELSSTRFRKGSPGID